jgi:hypothetical protein
VVVVSKEGVSTMPFERIAQLEQQLGHLQTQYQQVLAKHNELVELCFKIAIDTIAENGSTVIGESLSMSERQRRESIKTKLLTAKITTE